MGDVRGMGSSGWGGDNKQAAPLFFIATGERVKSYRKNDDGKNEPWDITAGVHLLAKPIINFAFSS